MNPHLCTLGAIALVAALAGTLVSAADPNAFAPASMMPPPGSKPKVSTPVISCAGATQASLNVQVCAGTTGAPAGFSIQWMTHADYVAYGGWPVDSGWPSVIPSYCKASFSGNANLSRYNLLAGECVTVNLGEFLFDNGASTECAYSSLECGTEYVFRAFAHATAPGQGGPQLQRSDFTANLSCSTLDCEHQDGCTYTQGFWKTHGPVGCNPSSSGNVWPVATLTLGSVEYTDAEICSILNQPAAGNGLIALAHQLIAAKLNIANQASPDDVEADVLAADALIGGLVVPPVGAGSLPPSVTSGLTTTLTSYNEGATGPGHCD